MKKTYFYIVLAIAFVLPAVLMVRLNDPAETSAVKATRSTAIDENHSQAATAAKERMEAVRQFNAAITQWEMASGAEGDRLEEQLRGLITDDNAEVILRSLSPHLQGTYVGNLLAENWARRDRTGAMQWLAAQEKSTPFQVNAMTRGWLSKDREGLQAYISSLSESDWKQKVMESTGRDALAGRDPEMAFHLLMGAGESPVKTALLGDAILQWSQWDPQSAVEEINKLPDSVLQEKLVLSVACGYALANPQAAADWLTQSIDTGALLDKGLAGVMQSWSSNGDPVQAVGWISKLPEEGTRNHAIQALIPAWKQNSPETLNIWVKELPDSPLRTQIIHIIASTNTADKY